MTTITKTFAPQQTDPHIRLFDMRGDLEAVVNLVELCFAETLDDNGRRYLRKMRAMADNPALLQFSAMASELAGAPLSGFVWEQDGRLVGNASLVPYSVNRRRFYLIANVAVHPEYRRRGIARGLTLKALERARLRGVSTVWLHVRRENQAALQLYARLGFAERTRRTNWVSDNRANFSSLKLPDGIKIKPAAAAHWNLQRAWLERSYPPEYSWHLPLRPGLVRPDWLGWLYRALSGADVRTWAALGGDRLLGLLTARATLERGADLFLAAPPDGDTEAIRALLAAVRGKYLPRQSLNLEYPGGQLADAFQAAGYREQQTLIWMALSFDQAH